MLFISFVLLFSMREVGTAQNNDDLSQQTVRNRAPIDTARLLSDAPLKSPMGALLRSAILPGWGQFYNRKYMKAGFALAVNAVLFQRILFYHRRWRNTLNRDFQNKRNLFTWYFGIAYALTLMDAYVDAYLYGFDEVFKVSFLPTSSVQRPGLAIRCQINF